MQNELIGEFTGKKTNHIILPDGRFETSSHGTGKLLGLDADLIATAIGSMANGFFLGEIDSKITTKDGQALHMKSSGGWESNENGVTRATSIQTTKSSTIDNLHEAVCLHEYITDESSNWSCKIYRWK